MKSIKKNTYISLFSSAGVGCFGFKEEGFECVATNELILRRLEIQKFNNKCKYSTGYICGDITNPTTKEALFTEIALWKKNESISQIDVVIATPPCQGMSVANHKKSDNEIARNSLVVESIKVILEVKPKFFIFENVPAFMKTVCTDLNGVEKPISEAINANLGRNYSYIAKIINFKDYGACSSRQRALVIGVSKELSDNISPYELFPEVVAEPTLRDVIGDMKPLLNFGEIDTDDFYHGFRVYPEHMRAWIQDLQEGESAFDNKDDTKKPHQIIEGKLVINQQKNADKYRRQLWDKVGPCIHTRNDQLASQNTVHPSDDRVFSIRELMKMMTIPNHFKWLDTELDVLNNLSFDEKKKLLKKEEMKIRQSLGEAVPTAIFKAIAKKINKSLGVNNLKTAEVGKLVSEYDFSNSVELIDFINKNSNNLSLTTLGEIAELSNTKRTDNGAFFTNKTLITKILDNIPDTDKEVIRILEPSAGVGNFIPLIWEKFGDKTLIIDVLDIDSKSIEVCKTLLEKHSIPSNVTINYITADFLLHDFESSKDGYLYDYIIGNPPFYKMKSSDEKLTLYRTKAINKSTTNICSFFLDKTLSLANYIAIVFPKFILNTPEFEVSRKTLSKKAVECIIDFGEKGFPGVLVETVALHINNDEKPKQTKVISVTKNIEIVQEQKYIFDSNLPYWVIYRNELFDEVCCKLDFDVFKVFRDRQMVNKHLSPTGDIRVIKSRNIDDTGTNILDIQDYDSYTSADIVSSMAVYNYLEADDVYLTPNMTYKPRVMKKPKGILVNGSVAILIPKDGISPTDEQLKYFSSDEYREFYQIARNYQTRSLNVDACSVYFYGLLRTNLKVQPILEKPKDPHFEHQFSLLAYCKEVV